MSNKNADFRYEQRTEQGRIIVALAGEIDLRSSPDLRNRLVQLAGDNRKQSIILDLSEVGYIDSSGVGTLVEFKRRMKQHQGDVLLVGLQPRVRSVFEITRLDQFFAIHDSLEEACRA